jgi:hypothetical protein
LLEIDIDFKPFGFFPRKIRKTMLPIHWSELSPKQLCAVPDFLQGRLNGLEALSIYLSINRGFAKRIDSYQGYCILKYLKYLEEIEPLEKFIINRISTLNAPSFRLENVTFGAYILGDTYYQNYKEGNSEDLNRFIACFYTGVIGYNENLIDIHAKLLKITDLRIREAVALNYELIRKWLDNIYPNVFKMKNELLTQGRYKNWLDIFNLICGKDEEKRKKYSQTLMHDMLKQGNSEGSIYLTTRDYSLS